MTDAFEVTAFGVFAFIATAGALGMTTTMSMFRSGIFLMASFIGVAGLFILLSADLIGLLQIMMYIGGMLVMILFMVLVMHDPGGAMMAGMDMGFAERWFSKGLVPRESPHDSHDGHTHRQGDRQEHNGDRQDEGAKDYQPSSQERHGMDDHHHSGRDHQSMQHKEHGGQEGCDIHHGGDSHGDTRMGEMDMSMVTPVRPGAAWLAGAIGLLLVGMLLLRPNWRMIDAMPHPNSAFSVGHLLMGKYMVAFEGAGFLILIGIFGAVLLARPSTYPDDPSRNARVAVDDKPEPIADEGIIPLAHASGPNEQHEHGRVGQERDA